MDGTPTLRLNEFILGSLDTQKVDLGRPSPNSLLTPSREIILTANDAVLADIKEAENNFDKLVGAHELCVLHFDAYGKDFIKEFKLSPDAWAQLVKQLALEVIRAASSESKAWVDAMVDPKATDAQRAALFRRAAARHVQYAAWAADGQGVDRHLFGSSTSRWELSTSQLSSKYRFCCTVVPDGYGLSYSIGDDYIRWTITSLKLETDVFKDCLAQAAMETRQMMERASRVVARL